MVLLFKVCSLELYFGIDEKNNNVGGPQVSVHVFFFFFLYPFFLSARAEILIDNKELNRNII